MVASTPMKRVADVPAESRSRRWFKTRNGNGAETNGAKGNGTEAAPNDKPAENGNGHHVEEEIVVGSPFAPPVAEGEKASVSAVKPMEEAPKARRTVHRLPSMIDVEAAVKQGTPMVKILRLIQLRAAVLEAQVDE